MEIYAASPEELRRVYLQAPVTPLISDITVTAIKNGVETDIQEVSANTNARSYHIVLPYFLVQEEGAIQVKWEFSYNENGADHEFVKTSLVHVVTPYLVLSEIEAIIEGTDFTAEGIEKSVRHAINSYCGQSFGQYRGIKEVAGTGETSLHLPERVIRLHSIEQKNFGYKLYDETDIIGDSFLGEHTFRLNGDGWFLSAGSHVGDGIKSDSHGYYSVNGPIFNPYGKSRGIYGKGRSLLIDATWGWEEVPHEVSEAAKLLANDYACDDGVYRDRYIGNIKAADWRLEFNEGAFARTGNVRADQLLSGYVIKRGWGII